MTTAWQLQTAARTLFMEARGEPLEGQEAVAHVLWNRVRDGRWGSNLATVCLWHAQFSGWWSPRGNPPAADPNFAAACALADDDPLLTNLVQIVQEAETTPDPTGGAKFYYALSIPEPAWAQSMVFCGQFGNQKFYREYE